MKILKYVPKPRNEVWINTKKAINKDIRTALEDDFPLGVEECKKLAPIFKGKTEAQTAALIWNYLRNYGKYRRDPAHNQIIRLPAFFLHNKSIGDCKTFALFARSVYAAMYPDLQTAYKFANYRDGNVPTHVYTVVKTRTGQPIIIDGCWHSFGTEKKYNFALPLNYKAMQVTTLAGTDDDSINAITPKQLLQLRKKLTPKQLFRLGTLPPKKRKAYLLRLLNPQRRQKAGNMLQLINHKGNPQQRDRIKKILALNKRLKMAQSKYDAGLLNKGFYRATVNQISDELSELKEEGGGINKKLTKEQKKARKAKRKAKLKKAGQKIKKGFKALGRGIATATLAPIRGGFLSVVALNVNGLASKLKLLLDMKDRSGWKKILEVWKNVGGFEPILKKTVNHGAKKKKLFLSKRAKKKWDKMMKDVKAKEGIKGINGMYDDGTYSIGYIGDSVYLGDCMAHDFDGACISPDASVINGTGIGIAPAVIAAAIAAATAIIGAMIPIIANALKKNHPEVAQQTLEEGQEIVDRTQGGAVYQQAYANAGGQPTSLIPPPMQPEEAPAEEGGEEEAPAEEVNEEAGVEEVDPAEGYDDVSTAEEMIEPMQGIEYIEGIGMAPEVQDALFKSLTNVASTGLQFAAVAVANKAKKNPKLKRTLQAAQNVGQGVVDNYMAQSYMQNAGFKPMPNLPAPMRAGAKKATVRKSGGFNIDTKTMLMLAALGGVALVALKK